MSNRAIRGQCRLPKYLNSDNDPLYKFHQWQTNLQILEVTEVKIVVRLDCVRRSPIFPVSSLRGKAHRHHSTRIFGSHNVLADCRSGK
jgi:hypothetical protein